MLEGNQLFTEIQVLIGYGISRNNWFFIRKLTSLLLVILRRSNAGLVIHYIVPLNAPALTRTSIMSGIRYLQLFDGKIKN